MSLLKGFTKLASFIPYAPKIHYGVKKLDSLDAKHPGEAWSAKIDGAHSVIKFKKGKLPDLFSHRRSKRTGGKIDYTSKLPHIKTPVDFNGQFRGETYAVDRTGKAVEPEIVTSFLNRTKENSLNYQKELGLKTRTALIDVESFNGKDMRSAPFEKKRELMEEVAKAYPEFTLPAIAWTPGAKERLKKDVLSGKHKQSKEGLIVHKTGIKGAPFLKAKIFNEHDVVVRDIFKEESPTGRKPMAGGFYYSWGENGDIKGRVGTGFSHAEKEDMLKHPEKYIGRVARVQATKVSKNKALLKPSFIHWHVEKNLEKIAVSKTWLHKYVRFGLRARRVPDPFDGRSHHFIAERVSSVSGGGSPHARRLLRTIEDTYFKKPVGPLKKEATIFAKQTIIIDKSYESDRGKATELAKQFADRVYTSRGTSTQWRFRQLPPSRFIEGSFRHKKIKPGVSIIYGQLKEDKKSDNPSEPLA